MRSWNWLVGLVGGLLMLTLVTAYAGSASGSMNKWAPPGNTIIEVTGDKANGFEILRYDGTSLHPPTDSEAKAECGEYDTRVARVRCRTEVRTWYRDLRDLKRALRYANSR